MNTKLLAFCLGDGTIGKDYMLQIVHCAQQKEYIEWKYSLINEEIPCSLPQLFNNRGYPSYRIHTKTNKQNNQDLKEIKEKLYGLKGEKYYSQEIVDSMDTFCFAVLYMDDGSLVAKKRNGKIHAFDLTISICGDIDECNRLINKLLQFGLRFTIKKDKGLFSIRCGTKSARKFLNLIKDKHPNFDCFSHSKFQDTKTHFTDFI